jgi:hypothetical protein
MPKPKPLTPFCGDDGQNALWQAHPPWIGDRLGCSPVTVLTYAKQLGLWTPLTNETGGTATAPAVVSPDAVHPFIPPPTREQLIAGSANPRRVYKIEA